MPTISTCPRCSAMVTIPEQLEATAWVRCPLCRAEYPLREAINAVPPILIPLEGSEFRGRGSLFSDAHAERKPVAGLCDEPQQPPLTSPSPSEIIKPDEGLLTTTDFTTAANPAGEVIQPDASQQSSSSVPPATVPAFPFQFSAAFFDSDVPHRGMSTEDSPQTTESHFDAEMFAGFINQSGKTQQNNLPQAESPFSRRRVQGKPKNALRILVEIILGGIVGLGIAYIALAWITGSQFPLPKPPRALKPILRFVLPDTIWEDKAPLKTKP